MGLSLVAQGLSSVANVSMSNLYKWRKVEQRAGKLTLQLDSAWFDASMNIMLDQIQAWSQETKCGRRVSYDMWQFNNEEQITVFLLKWS